MLTALKRPLGFETVTRIGVKLRLLLAGVLCVGLAACDAPSIRTAGDSTALNVQSVTVDTSKLATAVEGRTSSITKEQLAQQFTATLTEKLAEKSDPSGRPVQVNVTLEAFSLAPPLTRAVANTSSAEGVVSVTEIGTNAVVVPPTRLKGNTENIRGASAIGVLTTPSVENDIRGTINGFSNVVRNSLFGTDKVQ